MSIEIVNAFNSKRPDKRRSEDWYGFAPDHGAAWVIDGASAVHSGLRVVDSDEPTDAAWIARAYDGAIKATLTEKRFSSTQPQNFFRTCIERVAAEFCRRARRPVESLDRDLLPSATITFLYHDHDDNSLAFYTLGDSRGVLQKPDGGVAVTNKTLPEHFIEAEQYRAELKRQNRLNQIKQNRIEITQGMNNPAHPRHYAILSIHPDAADHITVQCQTKINPEEEAGALLCSDGFFNAVETGVRPDPVRLLSAASSQNGFANIVNTVRFTHPEADDDMTAVLVRVRGGVPRSSRRAILALMPIHIQPPRNAPLPLVFDSPHSGTNYPADFGYACPFQELEKAEDKYVDDLFAAAPDYGAFLLCAAFPRSYIDVNRAATDIDPELLHEPWPHSEISPSARSDAGIGLIRRLVRPGVPVYDRVLSAAEVLNRLQKYYDPYHAALGGLIHEAHYNFGQVWHINCHSMPANSARPRRAMTHRGSIVREADIVLGDRDGTTCDPIFINELKGFFRGLGYIVAVNDPFRGVELVKRYSNPARGLHSLQIEINKSLYMDENTGKKTKNYGAVKTDINKMMMFCADFVRSNLMDVAAD